MTVDYSLYYVTGRLLTPPGHDFYDNLAQACHGGVTLVQLREKHISTREMLEIATRCKLICDRYNVPLLINDRIDVALAVGCGIHVGQDDFPPSLARKLLGPDAIIGVSCNMSSELDVVLKEGVADYVGIGPAYDTASKKDLNPILGVRGVRDILAGLGRSEIKAVVIGGVGMGTIKNVLSQTPAVLEDGTYRSMDGIAVISAIAASTDPKKAAQALLAEFNNRPSYPLPSTPTSLSQPLLLDACKNLLTALRSGSSPLIHHITNTVVQNDCANLTLAFGASPIMSGSPEEAPELSKVVGSLLLNFGTLGVQQLEAQGIAGVEAKKNGRMVIFDPVGVGATTYRKTEAGELLSKVHMSIIKGNAGEIGALAGSSEVQARGVDSVGAGFANPARIVRDLARREKLVIAMSGECDYISDGTSTFMIKNGHKYQGVITGSGCMATSSIAVFAAVADGPAGPLIAAIAGILAINIAAEIAGARADVHGPNTFRSALIDECYNLTPSILVSRAQLIMIPDTDV